MEEDNLEGISLIFQDLLRIRQNLINAENKSISKHDASQESELEFQIEVSKKFCCFVSWKDAPSQDLPPRMKDLFREVTLFSFDYISLIQMRLELLGIGDEKSTISVVINKLAKSQSGITKFLSVMNLIFEKMDDFICPDASFKNLNMLKMEKKMKFKNIFWNNFDDLKSFIKTESKVSFSRFIHSQSKMNMSQNSNTIRMRSFANFNPNKINKNDILQQMFKSVTQRFFNASVEKNATTIRKILASKGKVILVGPSNTGKSFVMSLLRNLYELIFSIIKVNIEKMSLKENIYNPFIKMISEGNLKQFVNQQKIYVNPTTKRQSFNNNELNCRIKSEWIKLENADVKHGFLKWLLVDGQLTPEDESVLELIRDLKPDPRLVRLSHSEQTFSNKHNFSNPGIQVVLETDSIARFSPRVCLEFPVVSFAPSKTQAFDLFASLLKLPRDEFILEEIREFLGSICLPFLVNLANQDHLDVARSKKRQKKRNDGINAFKLRSRKKIKSIMGSKDKTLLSKQSTEDRNIFENKEFWKIMVNTVNIFKGFLTEVHKKIEFIQSERKKEQKLNKHRPSKPVKIGQILYQNVIKILCTFSLFTGSLLSDDRLARADKLLRKISKKHFVDINKKRKEKIRAERKLGNYLWSHEMVKVVEYPEDNLVTLFPELVLTSGGQITLEFRKFYENIDALSMNLTNEANTFSRTMSRLGSMRGLGSQIFRGSVVGRQKSTLKSDRSSIQTHFIAQDQIFIENENTWIARKYLTALKQVQILRVLTGGRRAGKLTILNKIFEDNKKKIHLKLDSYLLQNGMWKLIKEQQKKQNQKKINVILENVWMAEDILFEKLDEHLVGLDENQVKKVYEIDSIAKPRENEYDFWGTSHDRLNFSELGRLHGKTSVILGRDFNEQQVKKIFEMYFFKLLGNNPFILYLKDRIVKGVSVILDSFKQTQGQKLSLTRGIELIERVISTLTNIFQNQEGDNAQQSYFQQESIIKVLMWELSQEIFCENDRNLKQNREDYWRHRSEVVNKHLKFSFRKKMNVNLDLICRNHYTQKNAQLQQSEGLEQVKVIKIKDRVYIEDSVNTLKNFLSKTLGNSLKSINILDHTCLQRIIEFNYRLSLSRVLLFRGPNQKAKEYLQITRLLAEDNKLEVYDAQQVFESKILDLELLRKGRFESENQMTRLTGDYPLIGSDNTEVFAEKVSKTSFYTNTSEGMFTDSTDEPTQEESDSIESLFEEFLIRVCRDVLIDDKKVVVLIGEEHVKDEIRKLMLVVLKWADKLFFESKHFGKGEEILVGLRKEMRGRGFSGNKDVMLLIRQKLRENLSFVISVKSDLKVKEGERKNLFSDSINEHFGFFKEKTEIVLDMPVKDKYVQYLLKKKLGELDEYIQNELELERFTQIFNKVTKMIPEFQEADQTLFIEHFITCFKDKSKQLTKKRAHIEQLVILRNRLEKMQTNLKAESAKNSQKNLSIGHENIEHYKNLADDQNKLILIQQILAALKELPSTLDIQQAQAEKRMIQINILSESLVCTLIAFFCRLFRKDEKLLMSIIRLLKKERGLMNNSLATIVDFPFKDFDSDMRNILLFTKMRVFSKKKMTSILLVGEDPIFCALTQAADFSKKFLESSESDSDLEEKLIGTIRFGQSMLVSLETTSIPTIFGPLIHEQFVDQHGQPSVQVGNKMVGFSDDCRVFFSVAHKHILKKSHFKPNVLRNAFLLDFTPLSAKEFYYDLYLQQVYEEKPEMKIFKKQHTIKLVQLMQQISGKKDYLYKFLNKMFKGETRLEFQEAYFFVELEGILMNLREMASKKKSLSKLIQKIPKKNEFFQLASTLCWQLSNLRSDSNQLAMSFQTFSNFLNKTKNLAKDVTSKSLAFSTSVELLSREHKELIQFYLHSLLSLIPADQYLSKIFYFLNKLEIKIFENNSILIPLVEKKCDFYTNENKLKWAVDQLSMVNSEFNSFANYVSMTLTPSSVQDLGSDAFINRMYSEFLSTFTKSAETNSKTTPSQSLSYTTMSSKNNQNIEIYKNLDSIKLFFLKLFNVDGFFKKIEKYCWKVLKALQIDFNIETLTRPMELGEYPTLLSSLLTRNPHSFVFLYGDESNQINLDTCLTFARSVNSKLEPVIVFKPKPILLANTCSLKKKKEKIEPLFSRSQKQKIETSLRQAMMESRPVFLDLQNQNDAMVSTFFDWLGSLALNLSSPIFVGVRVPSLVPLHLRNQAHQITIRSPCELKPILLSIFSFNVFVRETYFNLLDEAKNKLLKIITFYSVFAYTVIFLRKRASDLLLKKEGVPLSFHEIMSIINDIKEICLEHFQLEFVFLRLKNCSLIREIKSEQVEQVFKCVFNDSFKSLVKKIQTNQMDFGKLKIFYSTCFAAFANIQKLSPNLPRFRRKANTQKVKLLEKPKSRPNFGKASTPIVSCSPCLTLLKN